MSSFDHIRVILSRFITMVLLMSLMLGQFGAVSGVAAQVDVVQGADLDGTPEPIEKPVDAIDDDEPDGIVDSGNSFATAPSTEQVREISLVEPVFLLVDTMVDAPLDPCRVIDSRWTSVLVQPFLETTWADPLTGLGGGLWIDIREDSSSFGWDMFAGGVVEGIVVPDRLDDPMAAANFYDYRPFAGAIAGDSGLSSPDGHSSSAYLCVPADEHTDGPSPESTATHIPPVMADEPSTTTPIDHDAISTPEGAVVVSAAIGIGSVVRITEALNMRSAPGLSAAVITVLAPDTIATIIGGPRVASGYTWWQLAALDGTGWSVVDYLAEQPVPVTPTATPTRTATATSTPPSDNIGIGNTVRVRQRLNLRDQPTTAGNVVVVMEIGTLGTVLDGPRTANGYTWWRLTTNVGTGWAAGRYLDLIPGTAIPSATPVRTATPLSPGTTIAGIGIGDLVRTTTRVNFRSAAGTQASVIVVLPTGYQASVVGGPVHASGFSWWRLQTNDGIGWVAAPYLIRVGVAPISTPTRTATHSPTITQTRTPSRTPTITSTPGTCDAFGYGDIVRAIVAVNFRTQPSTSASIIRTLQFGEYGAVQGGPKSANGFVWCQLTVGMTTGWVASEYLERVRGPVPTPDGTVTPRPVPPAPPGSGSASTIYSGSTSSGMIALTYDAGTDRGRAAYILDLLATYGAHATFGMTGTWARDNPDLVQRMVAEGHQLINHTWDHPSFTGGSTTITVLTRSARLDQLDRTENLVQQLTGYQMAPYWRPPYGDINASVLRDVYSGGYYVSVMWSCDTLGWNGLSEQQILNRCMYPSGAGDIILMHLTSDSLDWAATDDMLQYFQSKGLQIVTVEQLLAG